MALPADLANQAVVSKANALDPPSSDATTLRAATDAIVGAIEKARTACILPALLARQVAGKELLQSFVDASGLPFARMFADKSVLDEQQPAYIGRYDGGSWMKQCGNSWSPVTWCFVSER